MRGRERGRDGGGEGERERERDGGRGRERGGWSKVKEGEQVFLSLEDDGLVAEDVSSRVK